jgi:hypothetical protein
MRQLGALLSSRRRSGSDATPFADRRSADGGRSRLLAASARFEPKVARHKIRIVTCATGGRTLASKDLLARLDPDHAHALGLDPDRVTYTPLAQLPTAPEKARRDAPAVAVSEI